MAIKMKFEGVELECDSVAEAAELLLAVRSAVSRNGSSSTSQRSELPPADEKPRKTPDYAGFWGELPKESRELLRRLSQFGITGVEASQLAEELGMPLVSLGWLPRKMKPVAARHGLKFEQLLISKKTFVENKARTIYVPGGKLPELMASVQA